MVLALALLQASVTRPHVTVSLVPQLTAVVARMHQRLAVRFQMEPGWHIYWRNPGESGVATTVRWTLPTGFTVDSLDYPTPTRLDVAGVVTHVLEGDVVLETTLRVPKAIAVHEARITAKVAYGVCRDVCYPGSASLVLVLPVMTDAGPNAAMRVADSLFLAREPRTGASAVSTIVARDTATIVLALPRSCGVDSLTFFPWDRDVAPAAVTASGPRGCGPVMVRLPVRKVPMGTIRGVAVIGKQRQGYEVR